MKPLFLLDPSITFLNHGSYGAVPRPVFEDWQRWQAEVEHNPVRFLARSSAQWLRQAREGLATDLAYGACLATLRRVCEAQCAHLRVVKVALPLTHEGFAGAMIEAMGSATRVVFMSCITSPTALILPIEPALEEARRRGILSLIDGAHAPGQIDLNLNALGADFDTGNCHKWLCAPKGTAFFSGACRAPRHAACQRDELGLCGTRGSVELGRFHRFGPVRAAHAMARHTRPERLLGRARRHRIPAGARLAAQRERCHSMAIDLLHRVAHARAWRRLRPTKISARWRRWPSLTSLLRPCASACLSNSRLKCRSLSTRGAALCACRCRPMTAKPICSAWSRPCKRWGFSIDSVASPSLLTSGGKDASPENGCLACYSDACNASTRSSANSISRV